MNQRTRRCEIMSNVATSGLAGKASLNEPKIKTAELVLLPPQIGEGIRLGDLVRLWFAAELTRDIPEATLIRGLLRMRREHDEPET